MEEKVLDLWVYHRLVNILPHSEKSLRGSVKLVTTNRNSTENLILCATLRVKKCDLGQQNQVFSSHREVVGL